MGLLERMSTIIRANINELLDRAEDPEKMLNQLILDMEDQIQQARSQVAAMIAQEKELQADLEESRRLAAEWASKAELAVRQGRDDLAREALRRKRDYESHVQVYQSQYQSQAEMVARLKQQLSELESKYERTLRDKEVLIARYKAARAQRQVTQVTAELGSISPEAELQRMERKIRSEEAKAAAEQELAQSSLEAEFRKLESDQDVEQELAALKQKVHGQS
jgi:phage shock protein A